jgi:hypothetical protein
MWWVSLRWISYGSHSMVAMWWVALGYMHRQHVNSFREHGRDVKEIDEQEQQMDKELGSVKKTLMVS